MSSTIIAPPSTPTYHALSRASAGVASAVEASAMAMASLRICIPFLGCHYGQPKLTTQCLVSTQAKQNAPLWRGRNTYCALYAPSAQAPIKPCVRSAASIDASVARDSASIVAPPDGSAIAGWRAPTTWSPSILSTVAVSVPIAQPPSRNRATNASPITHTAMPSKGAPKRHPSAPHPASVFACPFFSLVGVLLSFLWL